jgi:hypothetical protein
MMNKPHKWAKEIKAWADGAEIEQKHTYQDEWRPVITPNWSQSLEFRIKPQPKEPQYLYFFKDNLGATFARTSTCSNRGDSYIGKIKLEDEDA